MYFWHKSFTFVHFVEDTVMDSSVFNFWLVFMSLILINIKKWKITENTHNAAYIMEIIQ